VLKIFQNTWNFQEYKRIRKA